MKLFGLKDENGKEYIIEADLRSCFHNVINVMPIESTPKLKVGYWYKYSQYIFRVISVDSEWIYFDAESSFVIGKPKIRHWSGWVDSCHLATREEIEKHLIALAEKKGFKKGTKYRDAENNAICEISGNKFDYYNGEGLADGYNGWIYYEGKWATIIPDKKPLPKTKDELKELVKVIIELCVGDNSYQKIKEFLDDYED